MESRPDRPAHPPRAVAAVSRPQRSPPVEDGVGVALHKAKQQVADTLFLWESRQEATPPNPSDERGRSPRRFFLQVAKVNEPQRPARIGRGNKCPHLGHCRSAASQYKRASVFEGKPWLTDSGSGAVPRGLKQAAR